MKKNKKKTRGSFVDVFTNLIIKLTKSILKLIIELLIGLLFGIYTLLEILYNILGIVYNKLPKVAQMAVIYTIIGVIALLILFPKQVIKYVGFETINEKEVVKYVEINDKTCKLDKTSCEIYLVGQAYGLTEEQSLMIVSIARWETGNYSSAVYNNKNNVGGNFKNGELATFDSLEQGINYFVSNLKNNYFDKGLNTLEKIQKVYAPVGADNDDKNINLNWLDGTKKIYERLVK